MMITSTSKADALDTKDPLLDYIESSNISSIEMIARSQHMSVDDVLTALEYYLNEGVLHGTISEDEKRFFKSNVRISAAPSIRSNKEELVIETADTKLSKYLMIGGILSIAGGLIAKALMPAAATIQSIGASAVLLGIAILAGGWLMLSRKTSSVKGV